MEFKESIKHNPNLNNMKKRNVLVTGGAGFIGSNLVEAMLNDERIGFVRVLDNLSNGHIRNIEPFLDNPNFEFLEGDNDLQNSIYSYQELVKLNNIIEKKFKINAKIINEDTKKKIKSIISKKNAQ